LTTNEFRQKGGIYEEPLWLIASGNGVSGRPLIAGGKSKLAISWLPEPNSGDDESEHTLKDSADCLWAESIRG